MVTIRAEWTRTEPRLIASLGSFSASQFSDACAGRGVLPSFIRRLHGKGVVVGSALTVSTMGRPDNLAPYAALKVLRPGDVVVIASDGCQEAALIGDNLVGLMRNAGAVAVVTDGLVRDAAGLDALCLPVHAAGHCPRAPSKQGPGAGGLPLQIGGIEISSGDLIVADADGVVAVPRTALAGLLTALQQIENKDQIKSRFIQAGGTVPLDLDEWLAKAGLRWD